MSKQKGRDMSHYSQYRYGEETHIELDSIAAYDLADALLAKGWKVVRGTPWSVTLRKEREE